MDCNPTKHISIHQQLPRT